MGATPFPKTTLHEFLDGIKSGRRLTQPKSCSAAYHGVVLHCQKESPEDRPTFASLVLTLTDFVWRNDVVSTKVSL